MASRSALTTAFLSSFTLPHPCGKPRHQLPTSHHPHPHWRNHPSAQASAPLSLQLFNARGEMTVRTLESLFGLRHQGDASPLDASELNDVWTVWDTAACYENVLSVRDLAYLGLHLTVVDEWVDARVIEIEIAGHDSREPEFNYEYSARDAGNSPSRIIPSHRYVATALQQPSHCASFGCGDRRRAAFIWTIQGKGIEYSHDKAQHDTGSDGAFGYSTALLYLFRGTSPRISATKKFAERELSLLHLQPNVEIPEASGSRSSSPCQGTESSEPLDSRVFGSSMTEGNVSKSSIGSTSRPATPGPVLIPSVKDLTSTLTPPTRTITPSPDLPKSLTRSGSAI
ncbi:hypothetical protein BDQ17DRAFT_1433133 [Cyathus striatus]|nr:hypothetical protein BDQ17DRAFT_1433133 [Cyathus striatus]